MIQDLREDPRAHRDWRRRKNGCPNFRERWFPQSDVAAGEPMYQVFCLMNTPPTTLEEEHKCLASHTRCWRLVAAEARLAAQRAAQQGTTPPRGSRRPA